MYVYIDHFQVYVILTKKPLISHYDYTGYNFENYKELYNTCSMSFCGTEPFYYKTMAV